MSASKCHLCGEKYDDSHMDMHMATMHTEKPSGDKHDKGKPRWSLIPCGTIAQVIAVMEFGANRYGVDNWMHVPDARRRYYDAAMRHIDAWLHGETLDPESGQPHLAHAVCCLLYILWFDRQESK